MNLQAGEPSKREKVAQAIKRLEHERHLLAKTDPKTNRKRIDQIDEEIFDLEQLYINL